MKLIAIEISIEHQPDEPSELPALEEQFGEGVKLCGARNESLQLSLNQEVADEVSTQEIVEKMNVELMRRYRNLNARKTN